MMPSSFHVTSRENLFGIFEEGIVPGGGSGRVVTFFNAFAPWDPRSYRLAKGRHIDGEKATFHVPTQVLMEEFEGRITDSGQPVTSMTVPFASLRGAWVSGEWHEVAPPHRPNGTRAVDPNGPQSLAVRLGGTSFFARPDYVPKMPAEWTQKLLRSLTLSRHSKTGRSSLVAKKRKQTTQSSSDT